MILKTMQTFVTELPKLETGEPATRARRCQQRVLQVSQALAPTGSHVMSWWNWIHQLVQEARKESIDASTSCRGGACRRRWCRRKGHERRLGGFG